VGPTLYEYALSSPLSLRDPTGLCPLEDLASELQRLLDTLRKRISGLLNRLYDNCSDTISTAFPYFVSRKCRCEFEVIPPPPPPRADARAWRNKYKTFKFVEWSGKCSGDEAENQCQLDCWLVHSRIAANIETQSGQDVSIPLASPFGKYYIHRKSVIRPVHFSCERE
jgi:hypothetical protein